MSKKIGFQGKPLKSQTRSVIWNVRNYFHEESIAEKPLLNIKQWSARTCKATGVSDYTLRKITREATILDKPGTSGTFTTPGKHRIKKKPITDLDNFDSGVVRRIIHSFYRKKEYPTALKIFEEMKKDINFNGSLTSVKTIIHRLGFKYVKFNYRKILLERVDLIAARQDFLRKLKKIDRKKCIYLDETWVNQNDARSKGWQDGTTYTIPKLPTGKGKRLIILHAGGINGFVKNGLLVFQSKKDCSDYHGEMNYEVFKEWFEKQLLPNIPQKSVIIMDNAPYHSVIKNKAPTMASSKADMIQWLKNNNIEIEPNLFKAELYNIIKLNKPNKVTYKIDEIAKSHGHEVLRLPAYHCELNPIELIWAQVKGHFASDIKTRKASELKGLVE
jgi:transposase